jgi:amino acid transporter
MTNNRSIGFFSVVAIGIGGMVGGGIFAVLGLAVELSRGGTPLAFAFAGIVALITSYSYAKLSVTYPSQGGTVEFLNQGFGPGLLTGGLNVLLWISYIVMLSLYAYAFGSYGANFFPVELQSYYKHILISGVIIIFTLINGMGANFVGKTEEWIVGLKISILSFFIIVGFWSINSQRLQTSAWNNIPQLIAGGMIIFLAYEGFELIANTACDVKNPKRSLPRAYYTSVIFVIILYILISIVTVGNLSVPDIINAKDYALAESAKPFLGNLGFIMIAIAALLSTSSAINATLYGTARVSYIIAKDGELPSTLEKKVWNRPLEGLIITAVATLIIANLFNLSSISVMGSTGFLIIFAAVNASNSILHKSTNSKKLISILGAIVCIFALLALIGERATTSWKDIIIVLIMIISAFSIEAIYRRITGRTIKPFFK